jgi:probable HAF family extracellular repeat protein
MGTVLNGINDSGQIVGFYTDAAANTHGMLVNRTE